MVTFRAHSLQAQCRHYMDLFGIDPADLVDASYSDLIVARTPGK